MNWKAFYYKGKKYSVNTVSSKQHGKVKFFSPREAYGAHIFVDKVRETNWFAQFPPTEEDIHLARAIKLWMINPMKMKLIPYLEKMLEGVSQCP